jgi:hypothetical protein
LKIDGYLRSSNQPNPAVSLFCFVLLGNFGLKQTTKRLLVCSFESRAAVEKVLQAISPPLLQQGGDSAAAETSSASAGWAEHETEAKLRRPEFIK